MCTLLIGDGILGRGTLLVGANRDEDPARPSHPPRLLREAPPVVGGRDVVAGGTWLAVRERRAVVAVLNRRDRWTSPRPAAAPEVATAPAGPAVAFPAPPPGRRSRGLLALEAAAADGAVGDVSALADAAVHSALRALEVDAYAPFSLAFLAPGCCRLLTHDPGAAPQIRDLDPGWHVLTHADLDDAREPRTARLLESLAGFGPRGEDEAIAGLLARLSWHGTPAGPGACAVPPVCIHHGRAVTVSSALVSISPGGARYLHVEGRPCEVSPVDYSRLLVGEPRSPAAG
jgi:hypothetical protein